MKLHLALLLITYSKKLVKDTVAPN